MARPTRTTIRSVHGFARLALATGTLSLLASDAHANGRFPSAEQLVVDPSDPSHVAVQVTYGFLSTRDAGTTWHWSCEEAVGYGGVYDPPLALLEGGVLIAGIFDGLAVASPDTCEWTLAEGALSERYVKDVSAWKGDPRRAIAIASNGLGSGQFRTQLFESVDAGASWSEAAADLPTDFLALTADLAPSDASLVYVSGFRAITETEYVGAIARSPDGGASWEVFDIPGTDNTSGPYLGAVDPNDPSRIYVRTAADLGQLFVSSDGGETFEVVTTLTAPLLGFALSPDGSEVMIGTELDGLLVASTSDLVFEQRSDVPVRCLTWTSDAVYACAREALAGFSVGKSVDEGASFEPFHRLACLDGPDPACAPGTSVGDACGEPWSTQKEVLRTELCDEGSGGSSGTSGSDGAGTSGGAESSSDGCGCAIEARRTRGAASALAMAGLVAIAMRRRAEGSRVSKERRVR
jgi:hypothetical protein